MKVTGLRINGIIEPVGYDFPFISVSWKVKEAKGKNPSMTKVELSKDKKFGSVLTVEEGVQLFGTGVTVSVALQPRTRYYVRVTVWDDCGDCGVGTTFFETGKMDEEWSAKWIGMQEDDRMHPVFSKKIKIKEQEVVKARLYICGLGLYEAYMNHHKIGYELLTPYLNDYTSAYQVQTYDITENIGLQNELKIYLGNGWYKGIYGSENGRTYGDKFALIAEIHLDYTDGSHEVIGTDDTFEYCGSDVEESSIYGGEILNRLLWEQESNRCKKAALLSMSTELLCDRHSIPILCKEIISAKEIIHTPAGEIVLDMGQNFAGWMTFYSRLPKGCKVHLEFGEIMQEGNFYNDNYRTATGGFTYVSDGREELVRPHFTYFGFRYVKVTGWEGELRKEDFNGYVLYSDLERTGYFETGDSKINRIYENSLWGLKSNFLDIPSDCPQRDERLGWTGDAQIFSAAASYHMDTRAFYRKYLWDMRHEQVKRNGGIPAYVPTVQDGPINAVTAVWGDAATIIPDTLKQFYGDCSDMSYYYPILKDWVDYVSDRVESVHGTDIALWDFDFQFGDWLALDGADEQAFSGDTPTDYIATMYYYHSVRIMEEFAGCLQKEEERDCYGKKADKLFDLLLEHFFTPVGHLSISTQAAYIVAMKFKVYRNKEVLVRDFVSLLKKHGNKIKCGFVVAPVICQMLSEYGREDIAYQILFQEEYPSWLYEVNLGATTMWERWNSVLPDGTISGTGMNSLNHYSYGTIAEFLYGHTIGLRPVAEGFREVVIMPKPHGQLRFAKGTYHSTAGTYEVSWEIIEDGKIHVHTEIPFGVKAHLILPGNGGAENLLECGTYDFVYVPETDFGQKYTENTPLGVILADEEAKKFLLEIIPQVAAVVGTSGTDVIPVSMLRQMSMLGITDEMVDQFVERLKQIWY